MELELKNIINLLGYVRKELSKTGKVVEFADLQDFEDKIDDTIDKLDDEELTLYKNSLQFFDILKKTNTMNFQKLMTSVKAIMNKVDSSKSKTEKAKKIKKEKIEAKKNAGEFIPKGELKKKLDDKLKAKTDRRAEKEKEMALENQDSARPEKIDFKKTKELLTKKLKDQNALEADSLKPKLEITKDKSSKEFKSRIADSENENENQKEDEDDGDKKEKIEKHIFKKKQKTQSFKSYDQYNRKEKRSEYKQLQTEERPFRSYGVDGNLERRQRKIEFIQAQKEAMKEGKTISHLAKDNRDLRNKDGSIMNRTDRRNFIRNEALNKNGEKSEIPRSNFDQGKDNRERNTPVVNNSYQQSQNRTGGRDFQSSSGGDNREQRVPKEWKSGQGSNSWGMDNMHPSWAAKRNLESQELGSFSKIAAKPKVIDL